ncbi:uncharacterized protein LOC110245151 [Exaiptasia diaphana]|uniref:Uncharacterized protein n=1 Tax=Exaiptasia diaphana TaxID=2652724 RepID=A0A913XM61_EXADI|nr:uncharacterized protein LOC110245151 [Exaiptasia diaphana]
MYINDKMRDEYGTRSSYSTSVAIGNVKNHKVTRKRSKQDNSHPNDIKSAPATIRKYRRSCDTTQIEKTFSTDSLLSCVSDLGPVWHEKDISDTISLRQYFTVHHDNDNAAVSSLSADKASLKSDEKDSRYLGSLESRHPCDDQNRDDKRYSTYSFLQVLTILGLQNCCVDDISRLPRDLRHHRDDEDWIMIFLEKNFYAIQDENFRQNLSEDLLDKIGFVRGSNAVLTILARSKTFLPKHLDAIDTVKRFVVDELRYSPDFSNKEDCQKVRQKQKEPKETFAVDSAITLEGNILEKIVHSKQVKVKIEELSQDNQTEVWFHGTDSQSAFDISWRGIIVSSGSPKRDFSDGKGFYLTNNFEDAKKWAFSITRKPAVLIFKIPKSCLETAKKLNLFKKSQKNPTWQEIVNANRSGILSWKMRTTLEEYDYIEGPVSVATESNSVQDVDSGAPTMTLRKARPQSHQICIINEDFADAIDEYISNVVLYNVLREQDLSQAKTN